MQLKPKNEICAVYAEGTVTDWTCHEWFTKFHAWDFSLDNAPCLGRSTEVDSNQIEALVENNQCYTTQEPTYSKYPNQ